MKYDINDYQVHINLSNTKQPLWSNGKHDHYKVKIVKDSKSYTFDFYNSIHGTEMGLTPTLETVLDCFALDVSIGELTFEEFCREYDFDSDSIKVLKSWQGCKKAANAAKRLNIPQETLNQWTEQ